jgi:putative endonuclease
VKILENGKYVFESRRPPQPSLEHSKSEGCRAEVKHRRATSNCASELRLGKPFKHRKREGIMKFFYVYILQSESDAKHFYVGLTEDLRARLKKHNAGEVPYTATFRPWKIKTAIAFTDKKRAVQFERYLKTASGRTFAKKRF